jgi:hypothetical protein
VSYDRKKIAYHEAGHAVMDWLLGRRVVSVRLFSGRRRFAGKSRRAHCPSIWFMSAVRDLSRVCPDIVPATEIVALHAGPVAEQIFQPSTDPDPMWWDGDIADILDALKLCDPIEDGHLPASLTGLRDLCFVYLQAHWTHVEALAEALLRDGRIVKSKDIRRILGPRTLPVRKVVEGVAQAWGCA